MSLLGVKTKKVTVYGRKKAQIISVHTDITPSKVNPPLRSPPLDADLSPVTPFKRPPLQAKASQDVINRQPIRVENVEKNIKEKAKVVKPRGSSPEGDIIVHKPRRVVRPGKVVIPRSPSSSVTPVKTTRNNRRRREVLDAVVITSVRKTIRDSSVDLAEHLAQISIAPAQPSESAEPTSAVDELLGVCTSPEVIPFEGFTTSQNLLSILPIKAKAQPVIRKIGEASYSEVFGITIANQSEVVVKVVPLMDEECILAAGGDEEELPDCSRAEDVRREVEITKRMSGLPGGGFVTFHAAFVVQGGYPKELLHAWDRFKDESSTKSLRPDGFSSEQRYTLIVLSHGGPDLESFQFLSTSGWVQAAGIFWQVVDSLDRAERCVRFEHRDIHEGQILITTNPIISSSKVNYLDPANTGVRSTIIDFGLSRLDMPDKSSVFIPYTDDLYDGIGDQWDVYRGIREVIKGDWKGYHPSTNVMWLQYILHYLLNSTALRKPRAQTNSRKKENLEKTRSRKAYEDLMKMEEAFLSSLGGKKRGNQIDGDGKFGCAGDVLSWGKEMGWVGEV